MKSDRPLIEGEISPGNTGRFFIDLLEPEDSDIYDIAKRMKLVNLEIKSKDIKTVLDADIGDTPVIKGFRIPQDSAVINDTPIGKIRIAGGTHINRINTLGDAYNSKNYSLISQEHVDFSSEPEYDLNVLFMKYPFLKDTHFEILREVLHYITVSLGESIDELIDRGELTKDNIGEWSLKIEEQKSQLEESESTKRFFLSLPEEVKNKVIEAIASTTNLTKDEIVNEIGYSISMTDIRDATNKFRF